jgi:hypothetical protein
VKNLKLLILAIGLTFTSCSNDNGVHKNKSASLEKMHVEILSLSTSKQCENSADWAFTSIGSKACGGPTVCCLFIKIKHN